MMDEIDDKGIKKLNKLVLNKTKALLDNKIDVIYFDATTLYFESFSEDINNPEDENEAIRKNGYSKDGKFNQPQVVLALLVTKQGIKPLVEIHLMVICPNEVTNALGVL